MNWLLCTVYGIAGLVLLYYGAEWMVKGGVSIARKCNISPLVIGLTLVAFATSAPELVVSIFSALQGKGDVALGNVVGSNICNITVILGLSALIAPIKVNRQMLKLDMPLLLTISVLLAFSAYFLGGVGRIAGLLFLLIGIGYTVFLIRASRKENREEEPEENILKLHWAILLAILGIAALVGGARLFVDSAVFVAKQLSVPDAVIGLTIVALGTSLPELATSAVAAFKGEQDIAIGNVVGSNILNILIIMGIAPLIRPIAAPGILLSDPGMMLGAAFALALLMKFRPTISRIAGGAFLLAACLYTAYLIARI